MTQQEHPDDAPRAAVAAMTTMKTIILLGQHGEADIEVPLFASFVPKGTNRFRSYALHASAFAAVIIHTQ